MAIRVLIVDPDANGRNGLRTALDAAQDVEVVGEVSSGEEAVKVVLDLMPDVVLMYVSPAGLDGPEAIRIIRNGRPDTRVILVSEDESGAAAYEAITAGAGGYLLKDVTLQRLVEVMSLVVAERGTVVDPRLVGALEEEVQRVNRQWLPPGLSERESEILQMVAYGGTTQEVSRDLGISPDEVKTHLEWILEKLGSNG